MTDQTITLPDYESVTGTTFRVATPPYAVQADLTLLKVTRTAPSSPAATASVSLVFQGPPQPFIAQGIYFVLHDRLPPQALFLVPIGEDNEGFRYEIIFNSHTDELTPDAPKGDAQ